MAPIAVGQGLQDARRAALFDLGQRSAHRIVESDDVHPVRLVALNAVAPSALLESLRAGRRAVDGGAHPVAVVLDDEEHGQAPECCHVEGLIDLALVEGPVAEEDQHRALLAAVLLGEGEPGPERHLGGDDSVAAVEPALKIEEVHGAALAPRRPVRAAEELAHHRRWRRAEGQSVAVGAVGGDEEVALACRRCGTAGDRLLADVEVAEAADLAKAVELPRPLLEAAQEKHLAVKSEELFARPIPGPEAARCLAVLRPFALARLCPLCPARRLPGGGLAAPALARPFLGGAGLAAGSSAASPCFFGGAFRLGLAVMAASYPPPPEAGNGRTRLHPGIPVPCSPHSPYSPPPASSPSPAPPFLLPPLFFFFGQEDQEVALGGEPRLGEGLLVQEVGIQRGGPQTGDTALQGRAFGPERCDLGLQGRRLFAQLPVG